jgi:hypothetical protein
MSVFMVEIQDSQIAAKLSKDTLVFAKILLEALERLGDKQIHTLCTHVLMNKDAESKKVQMLQEALNAVFKWDPDDRMRVFTATKEESKFVARYEIETAAEFIYNLAHNITGNDLIKLQEFLREEIGPTQYKKTAVYDLGCALIGASGMERRRSDFSSRLEAGNI